MLLSSSTKHLLKNMISGICSSSTHRVHRLEIAHGLRIFSHVGIFRLVPVSLVHHYSSPLRCVSKYMTYTGCGGGGGMVLCWRHRQVNSCRKVYFPGHILLSDMTTFCRAFYESHLSTHCTVYSTCASQSQM
jgi:hypothetical protein